MPNSYQSHVANGVSNSFSFASIDGYLQLSHLKVYVNGTLRATNTYTIDAAAKTVSLSTAPASGDVVKVARETPNTVATRPVDFTDGSVLTATDLDTANLQTIFLAQEAADSGGAAFQKTATNQSWDAQSIRISAVAPPTSGTDAATKDYVDALGLVGGLGGAPVAEPQAWAFTGNGSSTTFPLVDPAPNATQANLFIVEVGGVLQHPTTNYTVSDNGVLTLALAPTNGTTVRVRNFGIARSITGSVGTSLLANGAVTAQKIDAAAVVADKIQNNVIDANKLATSLMATGTFTPVYELYETALNTPRTATWTYNTSLTWGRWARIGNVFIFTVRLVTTGAPSLGNSSETDLVAISGLPTSFTQMANETAVATSYAAAWGTAAPSGGLVYPSLGRIALYTRSINGTFTYNSGTPASSTVTGTFGNSAGLLRRHMTSGSTYHNDLILSGTVAIF